GLCSPPQQPQNHRRAARGWCLRATWSDVSRVTETAEEQKWGLLEPEAAMASNSLFSTVTPCQQNFFWGEYLRSPVADSLLETGRLRGLGSRKGLGVGGGGQLLRCG
uniref:Uncharacterized protein n=1 Tax=Poecilia latipinna TaxID=48699 RepID=A0A3B3VLC0_9TELE